MKGRQGKCRWTVIEANRLADPQPRPILTVTEAIILATNTHIQYIYGYVYRGRLQADITNWMQKTVALVDSIIIHRGTAAGRCLVRVPSQGSTGAEWEHGWVQHLNRWFPAFVCRIFVYIYPRKYIFSWPLHFKQVSVTNILSMTSRINIHQHIHTPQGGELLIFQPISYPFSIRFPNYFAIFC